MNFLTFILLFSCFSRAFMAVKVYGLFLLRTIHLWAIHCGLSISRTIHLRTLSLPGLFISRLIISGLLISVGVLNIREIWALTLILCILFLKVTCTTAQHKRSTFEAPKRRRAGNCRLVSSSASADVCRRYAARETSSRKRHSWRDVAHGNFSVDDVCRLRHDHEQHEPPVVSDGRFRRRWEKTGGKLLFFLWLQQIIRFQQWCQF